jgi:hypothetical protein
MYTNKDRHYTTIGLAFEVKVRDIFLFLSVAGLLVGAFAAGFMA